MKKAISTVIVFFLSCGILTAEEIFNHPTTAKNISSTMPKFENTTCKFEQQKYLKTSSVTLKSSGNFNFLKDKGVIFETTYPIQTTTSYTTEQNKRISSIIKAIINKNYAYLEKNFDLYYKKTTTDVWILALKPKTTGHLKGELCSILIYGNSVNNKGVINKMTFDTSNTKTTIKFQNCR